MTESELASILPLFRGEMRTVREALKGYPEIGRIDIGVIRKILGYSGERLKVNATPKLLKKMVNDYRAGRGSLRGLAKKNHVAPKTFQAALHKAKINTARQDMWSTFREKKLLVMASRGITYGEIARQMGCSVSAISQKAKRLGLPPSRNGERTRFKKKGTR